MTFPDLTSIPPVSGSFYDVYLKTNGLDILILLSCWSGIVGGMTYASIYNFRTYRKYTKEKNLKNFELMEEDEKLEKGGGTNFIITFFIWVLSIVMSVNVYTTM